MSLSVQGRCAGAVFTGGASSRMGTDKAFIEIDGTAMAVRAATTLLSAGVTEVFAVGGDAARIEALGLAYVPDLHPGLGPLGAVITALSSLSPEFDAVVTMPCDLIQPDPDAVRAVVDGLRTATALSEASRGAGTRHEDGYDESSKALLQRRQVTRLARPDEDGRDNPSIVSQPDTGVLGRIDVVVPVAGTGPQWLQAAWRQTALSTLSAAFARGVRAPSRTVYDLCSVSVSVDGNAWCRDADTPEDLPSTASQASAHRRRCADQGD